MFGFGLDILVIWWAFRINFRRARATEEIWITPSELRVRRVSHRGHVVEWVLNPLWVQLDQKSDPEFGIEKLYLVSRGRRVTIAGLLGPDEKASFCQSLIGRTACRQARPDLQPDRMRGCRESGGLATATVLHQNHDEPRHE